MNSKKVPLESANWGFQLPISEPVQNIVFSGEDSGWSELEAVRINEILSSAICMLRFEGSEGSLKLAEFLESIAIIRDDDPNSPFGMQANYPRSVVLVNQKWVATSTRRVFTSRVVDFCHEADHLRLDYFLPDEMTPFDKTREKNFREIRNYTSDIWRSELLKRYLKEFDIELDKWLPQAELLTQQYQIHLALYNTQQKLLELFEACSGTPMWQFQLTFYNEKRMPERVWFIDELSSFVLNPTINDRCIDAERLENLLRVAEKESRKIAPKIETKCKEAFDTHIKFAEAITAANASIRQTPVF